MNGVEEMRRGRTSKTTVRRYGLPRRFSSTVFLDVVLLLVATGLQAQQRRQTFEQQMQDNLRRLEGIRRERSTVEEQLGRLRTQAHSLSDELANIDRQKQTTNRLVNELDRQINGL